MILVNSSQSISASQQNVIKSQPKCEALTLQLNIIDNSQLNSLNNKLLFVAR